MCRRCGGIDLALPCMRVSVVVRLGVATVMGTVTPAVLRSPSLHVPSTVSVQIAVMTDVLGDALIVIVALRALAPVALVAAIQI